MLTRRGNRKRKCQKQAGIINCFVAGESNGVFQRWVNLHLVRWALLLTYSLPSQKNARIFWGYKPPGSVHVNPSPSKPALHLQTPSTHSAFRSHLAHLSTRTKRVNYYSFAHPRWSKKEYFHDKIQRWLELATIKDTWWSQWLWYLWLVIIQIMITVINCDYDTYD